MGVTSPVNARKSLLSFLFLHFFMYFFSSLFSYFIAYTHTEYLLDAIDLVPAKRIHAWEFMKLHNLYNICDLELIAVQKYGSISAMERVRSMREKNNFPELPVYSLYIFFF
jgi:hypothetical protein